MEMLLHRVNKAGPGRSFGRLTGACLALALAACGGGGGGGESAAGGGNGSSVSTSPPSTASGTASPAPVAAQLLFHAAWTASPVDALSSTSGFSPPQALTLSNQTLRQTVRVAIGGTSFRLRLSNLYGTVPLVISNVHIARSTGDTAVDVATDSVVGFSGQAAVTIAPGSEVLSDPVSVFAPALSQLAVSMAFAAPVSITTAHGFARDKVYVASGDQSSAQVLPAGAQALTANYVLNAVEAVDTQAKRVVVAFGDSITEGVHATSNGARSYPDQLNDRLQAAGLAYVGVINAGIAGNRWLADGIGPSGTKRFQRDALNAAGASHVILLLGINDILFSGASGTPEEVSVARLIAAISEAANEARTRGLKVIGGTLAPCALPGTSEAKRQALNAWVRSSGAFDGVVDFDAALRAPGNPGLLNPLYDSGDGLHPNDAGYGAMATAVNLALFQ
ncbi:SGNH/GDSL hydrolase family protein [Noviherbaspirillum pedocola]|uniref:SGNH/GDSL hydrolase family protein n=1 Tax=Noviherbaspirillum pedocola TaxID=2801341 RepID=A0A934W6K0_9BURK|nr:SGNH/GDSL hydrolase family protein [Noviherbaspirillum pedocola]MBK4735205.1 SGNH/GDSL hydrolase family protein [Noviherbaspirillum pedocola]